MPTEWKGVFTALVTPFKQDGSLYEAGLRKLVRRQVEAGIHGLVPCGTTGESPALEEHEWKRVIEITVEEAKGKAWIVAGSGTNNTALSVRRTKMVRDLGADGALVITPYYNKPTADGLIRHFSNIADAVPDLPLMLYNVPGRTGVNMTAETQRDLAGLKNVVAFKEASGNLAQVWDVIRKVIGQAVVFSGEDAVNLPIYDLGGSGAVSVMSNLVPEKMVDQWTARLDGRTANAYELHRRFERLAKVLFIETSPAPVKYALELMKLPAGEVRPPLAPLREESKKVIREELKRLHLAG